MKRLIFISSLVFALLIMYACNEEQGVNKTINKNVGNPQNGNLSNPYDSLGVIHNEGLAYYFNNDYANLTTHTVIIDSLPYLTYDAFINSLNSTKDYMNSRGYSEQAILDFENETINIFQNANMFFQYNNKTLVKNIWEKMPEIMQAAINLGYCTSAEVNDIMPLYYAAKNDVSTDSLQSLVDAYPMTSMTSTLIAVSVYNYSKDYWNGFTQDPPPTCGIGNWLKHFIDRNQKEIVDAIAVVCTVEEAGTASIFFGMYISDVYASSNTQ